MPIEFTGQGCGAKLGFNQIVSIVTLGHIIMDTH